MKQVIEFTAKPYEYDENATPYENEIMKNLFSLSVDELNQILSDINSIIRYFHLDVELYSDGRYYFSITGNIPEDIVAMFEEVLASYCDGTVDKIDYCIGELS